MSNIFPNGQPSFPGTIHEIYETKFKTRFRDKSIMDRLTNSEYQGRFKGKGDTIIVPVLPIMQTHKMKAGDGFKYQRPKGSEEKFKIDRMRYFGLHFQFQDDLFSAIDIKAPVIAEANRQMAEDVENEFLADIINKTHPDNTGNEAGVRSKSFKLGAATDPVTLFKTSDAASNGTADGANGGKNVVVDYIVSAINAMNEMPGGLDTTPFVVIPTAIANLLQTSELKMANWMGDAQSVVRKGVQFLGTLNGASIIVNNSLPMWKGDASASNAYEKKNRYCVFFGDKSAVSFAHECKFEEVLSDKDVEGKFHRTFLVYDWFVRYPERIGAGFVTIG